MHNMMTQMGESKLQAVNPKSITQQALPNSLPIQINKVLPRLKEGGAYVKFSHDSSIQTSEIEAKLQDYLDEKGVKPWFNPFARVHSHLVRGRPWLEDLQRYPSTKLKVEFLPTSPGREAVELTEEILYSLFRKYGQLGGTLILGYFSLTEFNVREMLLLSQLKITSLTNATSSS